MTEQTAAAARGMAMVDVQRSASVCAAPTDRTDAVLLSEHRVVLIARDPVKAPPRSVLALSSIRRLQSPPLIERTNLFGVTLAPPLLLRAFNLTTASGSAFTASNGGTPAT